MKFSPPEELTLRAAAADAAIMPLFGGRTGYLPKRAGKERPEEHGGMNARKV
jgi:hypothetical protein